jgi:hypothetical protein
MRKRLIVELELELELVLEAVALTVTLTHPRPKSAPWFRSQMLWQFEFEFDEFEDLAPQADGQREQNCPYHSHKRLTWRNPVVLMSIAPGEF